MGGCENLLADHVGKEREENMHHAGFPLTTTFFNVLSYFNSNAC